MSHTIRAIATPLLARGFRLAGLATDVADSPSQTLARLATIARGDDAGLVLVPLEHWMALDEDARAELERRPLPIIVPVPGPAWGRGVRRAEDYILDLLQRAIGYRVRLR